MRFTIYNSFENEMKGCIVLSFTIMTDSAANLTTKQIVDYGVKVVTMSYVANGEEFPSYVEGQEPDYKAFYNRLRNKEHITTSLVSYDRAEALLKTELEAGNDILYIAFSSALSGSYQIAKNCMDDLREGYPDRKMIIVDSLCASLGQGLFVKYAVDMKNSGATLEDTAAWLEENKLRLVHLFTVDDLFFLKRGGRLSGATAVVGTILNIKPLLHVSDEGKLVSTGKTRGRKNSIDQLIARMGEVGQDLENQEIFIVHGDCIEDAEYAANEIKRLYKVKNIVINYVDPVIACHSGPGTLALFCLGSVR